MIYERTNLLFYRSQRSSKSRYPIHCTANRGAHSFTDPTRRSLLWCRRAVGYDTLAAQILFNLRDTICPQIKVILVYPFDGFTHFWTDAQRSLYAKLLPRYNKITQVSERNCPAAYLRRNRHLVDHSAYCICYCTRQTGGTAYTVQYARQMGLQILYTAPGMAQFS